MRICDRMILTLMMSALIFANLGQATFSDASAVQWRQIPFVDDTWILGIAFDGNRYVAVGDGVAFTSNDSIVWTRQDVGTSKRLFEVEWINNWFYAVGMEGVILRSKDGVKWENVSVITNASLHDIDWNGRVYVIVGDNGIVYHSEDGEKWTKVSLGTDLAIDAVCWGNNQFVAVGDKAVIFVSNDGVKWTKTLEAAAPLIDVLWDGERYVAVGYFEGVILISQDGFHWSEKKPAELTLFEAIANDGHRSVAVGFGGSIQTSLDGSRWTVMRSGVETQLEDVIWTGQKFLAVGWEGMILSFEPVDVIKVIVNEKPLIFDVPPVISNGRVLVPMRKIFESMKLEVSWEAKTQTIRAAGDGKTITMTVGSNTAYVDGRAVALEVPPTIIRGRVMVPARFVGETLSAQVEWDGVTQTVLIKSESQ